MKTYIFTYSYFCLFLFCCNISFSKSLIKVNLMKITQISFSGSNPSMGPYNSKSKNELVNLDKYQKELEELLNNTLVNKLVTLKEYLELRMNKNKEELSRIYKAYDASEKKVGARIIDLNIYIENHGLISLSDLRDYSLTGKGYTDFQELMKDHGIHTETSVDEPLYKPPTVPSNYLDVDSIDSKIPSKHFDEDTINIKKPSK